MAYFPRTFFAQSYWNRHFGPLGGVALVVLSVLLDWKHITTRVLFHDLTADRD